MVFDFFLWVVGKTRTGKVVEVIGSLENICRRTLAMHWWLQCFYSCLKNAKQTITTNSPIRCFSRCIRTMSTWRLGFRGYPFTWSNKRPSDANTKVRLDQAVAIKERREKYQLSTVIHLSSHASNYMPIVLQTQRTKWASTLFGQIN